VDDLSDLQNPQSSRKQGKLIAGAGPPKPTGQMAAAGLLLALLSIVMLASIHRPASEVSPATLPPLDQCTLGAPPSSTTWHLPDFPLVDAMRDSILHTFQLSQIEFAGPEGTITGLVPSQEYGLVYVRDTSSMVRGVSYFYGEEYLRTPVEEFLRRQYDAGTESQDGDVPGAGAISAVLAPDGHVDKATAVSDEEVHLIHAAYQYYKIAGGTDWLQKRLGGETVLSRLNHALDWLYSQRYDSTYQLVKRGHTTDWGDVKFEPSAHPTDIDQDEDHWTCSIYDQALTYRALLELAEMNETLGAVPRAEDLRRRAEELRRATNAHLWNEDGGFYRLHVHVTPLTHPFPEEQMVAVSNALAVSVGLSDPAQTNSAFASLERARLSAGAGKPGLSIYPPYPPGFFAHPQMYSGEYQNGGLWDWWGGIQITAEFESGHSTLARAHLNLVARDWASHPQEIYEWHDLATGEGWGARNYSSGAATVAEAIIQGLYGITIDRDGVAIQPRLASHNGQIRVLQPATGLYASYDYRSEPGFIALDYGSNHPGPVQVAVLLPRGRTTREVSIDGEPVTHHMETLLDDSYCAFQGPSGVHRAVITF
jgi:hypothetical protein